MNRLSTLTIVASLVFVAVFSSPALGQQTKISPFGWDLRYESLSEKSRAELPTQSHWLRHDLSYVIARIIDEWKGEPIRSSVLVELPSYNGSGTRSLWFVRTRSNAYFWEYGGNRPSQYQGTEFEKKHYERMFRSLNAVRQSQPRAYENPRMNWKGYYGALSTYNCVSSKCSSKQILLTWDDFYPLDRTETKSAGPGPVAAALDRTFAEMSSSDLLLFRTCRDRPDPRDFTPVDERTAQCTFDLFSDEALSNKSLSGRSKCFTYRGYTFRAKFAEDDQPSEMRIFDYSFAGFYALRQVLPVESWFSLTLRKNLLEPISFDPALRYSTSIYEDDCVFIENRTSTALTASVQSVWRVQWKDRADN